jgi:DNA-binding transcriptional LysR family regulator
LKPSIFSIKERSVLEIRHLRTFLAVARHLSFNKAAKELHYAQSSVSAQIQSLEEELNVKLFDRLGRGILLTEAGERLEPYARKMLDLSEETLSDIAGEMMPRGRLIIRVPESMAICHLPAAVARFHEQFPEVQLTFTTCAHEGVQ